MAAQPAFAVVEYGGHYYPDTPGAFDPDLRLFVCEGRPVNGRPVARLVGPTPSPDGHYLSVVDLEGNVLA